MKYLTVEQSEVLLARVVHKLGDNKDAIGRLLHERGERLGKTRHLDSSEKLVDRAFKSAATAGLTVRQAEELLGLLGYEGTDAIDRFLAEHLASRTGRLIETIHTAFADAEREAYAHRDSQSGYGTRKVTGSVIEVRRFYDPGSPFRAWGIAAENVKLEDTGFRFEPAPGLRCESVTVTGRNWPKWVLYDVLPPDVDDAQDGTVTLRLAGTDYATVKQCDPSIYADYGSAPTYVDGERVIDNGMRAENRRLYGLLDPKRSRIPYCLTLFYVLLLADRKVLFMRRGQHVDWFPGTVEFSGGEQLRAEDLAQRRPFLAWVKRAIREEFLVGHVEDYIVRAELEDALYGKARLSAIGFDALTCSFPLFALCESRCTEAEYLALYQRAQHQADGSRAPDNEGSLCVMTLDEAVRLMEDGNARGRVLRTGREFGFVLESAGGVGDIKLSAEALHPMTAYRLRLIGEFLA